MVRQRGRQSLNSSVLTVTNNSVLDDGEKSTSDPREYNEFIKRFGRPDLDNDSDVELIGYEKNIAEIEARIQNLLSNEIKEQDFALITGPSGTGKTTIVRKLAQKYSSAEKEPKLNFFYLKSSWALERIFGNPENRLRYLFDEAIQKEPSLIFIDKIDLICAEKRHQSDSKERTFNTIEDKLEYLNSISARVLVLAATDRPEILDPQIRKPCYFSDEIKFSLPSRQDRAAMIKHLAGKFQNDLTDEQVELIADASHCYSYRDLSKLCNVALRDSKKEDQTSILNYESLKRALTKFKPVAIKSITSPCPRLHWQDIGGVEDVKKELQESVIWPLEHREKFQRLGISSNKGAILYGPPGCSKTMLAQALATESGYNFISVKGPELFSKWVGDSEAAVRRLYRNAREIAPCIIFFDEIDGFAPERSDNNSSSVGDKVVAQLLTELNGVEPLDNVYTIAATNRPDRVDSALLRPGRLDPAIYIPLPSEENRREIFKVHMRPLSLKFEEPLEEVVDKLAAKTVGYSGAEVANVCRVAGTLALRESLDNDHIEWKHFEAALEKVQPRTKPENLKAYERFQQMSLHLGKNTVLGNSNSASVVSPKVSAESSSAESSLSSSSQGSIITQTEPNANGFATSNGKADPTSGGDSEDEATITEAKKRSTLDRLMRSLRLKKRAK